MTDMERPETTAVVREEAEAAAPAAAEGVPTPKAAGPHVPPVGAATNLIGNTVYGVLLKDRDLTTVPLDELMALQMATVECSENLISETPFEIAKCEAERWRKSSNQVLDTLYRVQLDLDQIQRLHSQDPTRNLAELTLPKDNGVNSGVTYAELQIRRQALQLRQQNLKAGSAFWYHVCFEIIVSPTSDLAPLDSLPASSRGLALQSADHLQDMLRWTLGRFGRLQCYKICAAMSATL